MQLLIPVSFVHHIELQNF